jgi:hypothetical protein
MWVTYWRTTKGDFRYAYHELERDAKQHAIAMHTIGLWADVYFDEDAGIGAEANSEG